jgi:hypothetical protein
MALHGLAGSSFKRIGATQRNPQNRMDAVSKVSVTLGQSIYL